MDEPVRSETVSIKLTSIEKKEVEQSAKLSGSNPSA